MTQNITILRNMGGLVFDGVFRESHSSTLRVTDNPVDSGATVSDHAFMEPQRLRIEAGVSNTPLVLRASDEFSASTSRAQKAYEMLQALQASAEPFSVQTGLKLYTNMLVINLSAEQDKDTSQVLDFAAELREIVIVNTQTVKYPARRRAGSTARQASATKKAGEQQGKTVPSPAKTSLLKKILRPGP